MGTKLTKVIKVTEEDHKIIKIIQANMGYKSGEEVLHECLINCHLYQKYGNLHKTTSKTLPH